MNYKLLFTENIPLIDVRAPIEFEKGHFPCSVNLPLLDNNERSQVGTVYKQEGQDAAVSLGHQLVSGDTKARRIRSWLQFIEAHPAAKLYCFRGGLRSQISKSWIESAGASVQIVPGGFKELRRFLISTLIQESEDREFILLGGKTGSGKTRFLYQQAEPFLDLEKSTHHRGSSFGIKGVQPAQVTFENRLAIQLLNIPSARPTLVEDESVMIGTCIIPPVLFSRMLKAKIIVLERPEIERADHIIQEYVFDRTRDLCGDAHETHIELRAALARLAKKLGGLRYSEILKSLDHAFQSKEVNELEPHRAWVLALLQSYYDPYYARGLDKRKDRILFRGDFAECQYFLRKYSHLICASNA